MNLGKRVEKTAPKSPQYPPAFDRLAKAEKRSSKHINIVSHVDDTTLIDKSGKLIKIFQLSGINFVTQSESFLDALKHHRNTYLKSFTSEYAVYFWTVRTKTAPFPNGEFHQPFATQVNEKYHAKIQRTEMYHSTLYMAVVTKPPEGIVTKGLTIFKTLNQAVDKAAKQAYLNQRHQELNAITKKTLSAFADYHIELLSVYEKNGLHFSRPLELIGQLINFEKNTVPLVIQEASVYLPNKRLFFNRRSGTIELRNGDLSKRFAAVLSIKDYAPFSFAGLLDGLNTLRAEYVLTQSYRFYDRHQAKEKLRGQQIDMAQSKDESISQTEEISASFDAAASGEAGFGIHHLTLVCYADNQEQLNKQVGEIIALFSHLDMQCVREDIACECGFWAQLPGNFAYIARPADISTKNMASFASLHNYATGKLRGNYWGEAVTVFETLSGSPYYFNFHYKDVGNFLVFGTMGSGKTVLVGFLIAQSLKFGGKRVVFDKDRGLEILVRALGGIYETIKPGIATGFNPCQLEDTPENRKFLGALFKKMVSITGEPLSDGDLAVIENAIEGLYRLDKSERQCCHMASFFGAKKRGSLRARFDLWHSDGAHAWLFDHAQDSLNLNADVLGFDLSHILSDDDCKTPALMYLTHRIEEQIAGQRAILFCDEGWLALSDEYFKTLFNDWSRTPRKKNNVFGLATQDAEDTVKYAISKTLNTAAACKIFFPNPSASREIYIGEFGLSEQEYHLVKTLPKDQHCFLLNYGMGAESVVIRANLEGLEDEIAVISAREKTLQLLDKLRAKVGDAPAAWLPLFQARWREEIRP